MNKKQCQQYLKQKIHPILEKLVVDILIDKPNEPLQFMFNWIKNKIDANKPKIPLPTKVPLADKNISPATSEDEEQEQKVVKPPVQPKKNGRTSVSAEAFGLFNQKKAFVPREIKKSAEQMTKIQQRIMKSFMFNSLEEKDLKTVVKAMEEKKFNKNQFVIKQYDDGNQLYIVQSGELECFKQFKKDEQPKFLKTYFPGDSFGELSLLYNVPRQASIRCKTPCILWSLDRSTFTNIVRDSAIARRQKYEKFLKGVELFNGMQSYQLIKIGQTLKTVKVKAGEYIFKEGDPGKQMYFVEQGLMNAVKNINGVQKVVFNYKEGDYFGEIALMREVTRQASIVCVTDGVILSMCKQAFERLIGKQNPAIVKHLDKYEGFKK